MSMKTDDNTSKEAVSFSHKKYLQIEHEVQKQKKFI